MALDIQLLKTISETPGAPGREHPIREVVLEIVKPYIDHYEIDAMGNLICLRKGKQAKKVVAAAHLDEISLMVRFVDKKGYAHFHPLGGFDPKTLIGVRVVAHGKQPLIGVIATKPIHLAKPADLDKKLTLQDLVIDFGMPGDKLKELLSVGDVCTRYQDLIEMGDCVNGKSLDNRVSVYVLIETLRKLKHTEYDFYAVFSVQEEVGLRGAQVVAHQLNAEFGFGLDTTIAYDLPEAAENEMVTSLGSGAAIKYYDASVITDIRMVNYMKGIAGKHSIKWQPELLSAGGTDTGALQRFSKNGTIVGCVSIPTRHIHTTVETCHKEDIQNAIDLLTACVEDLHNFDYSWS